jgi:hypothetical protein
VVQELSFMGDCPVGVECIDMDYIQLIVI